MTHYAYVTPKSESYIPLALGGVMAVAAVWLTMNGYLLGFDGEPDSFLGSRMSAVIWIILGIGGVYFLILGIRNLLAPDRTIEVSADRVSLPTGPNGKQMVTLRPDQVRAITVIGSGRRSHLRVDYDGGVASVAGYQLRPRSSFAALANDVSNVVGIPIATRAWGDNQAPT